MTDIVDRIDANKRNSTVLEDEAAEVIVALRQRVKELEGYKAAWIETAKHRDTAERELSAKNTRFASLEAEYEEYMKEKVTEMDALRNELATLKQQGEPFGWYWETDHEDGIVVNDHSGDYYVQSYWTPLYTAPPTCFNTHED